MAYETEKPVAQLMYEQDRKTAKEISKEVGVPLATVYRWIKDSGWRQSKVDRVLNKVEQLANLRVLVDKATQELLSSDNPDQAKINILRGYQKLLAEFEKSADMRGTIIQGLDAFIKFVRTEHPDAVSILLPYFQTFPAWVNKNYPEIR
jgi:hypothetical protein